MTTAPARRSPPGVGAILIMGRAGCWLIARAGVRVSDTTRCPSKGSNPCRVPPIMGESARLDDDCAKSMASRGTPTITVSHAMGQQPGQDRHSPYLSGPALPTAGVALFKCEPRVNSVRAPGKVLHLARALQTGHGRA